MYTQRIYGILKKAFFFCIVVPYGYGRKIDYSHKGTNDSRAIGIYRRRWNTFEITMTCRKDERGCDKAVKYVDRLIDRLVSQSLADADGGREAEC